MFLARTQKAIQGNRVLAYLRMDQKRDIGMKVPQRVKRRKWNVHEVAASTDIHQHLVRPFVAKRSAKLCNHLLFTRSRLWRRVSRVSTQRHGLLVPSAPNKFPFT